jgi:CBS domain-containing protein
MEVKEIMYKHPITVESDASISDVWKLLYKKGVHGLPVVDQHNKLLGVISEEDILEKLYPQYDEFFLDLAFTDVDEIEKNSKDISRLTAKDLMAEHIYSIHEDTHIMAALSKMLIYNLRQLPIVDDKNILVGIISKGDIFDILFKNYLKND